MGRTFLVVYVHFNDKLFHKSSFKLNGTVYRLLRKGLSVCVCVCVCVCERERESVGGWVCVCVCVCRKMKASHHLSDRDAQIL